MPDLRPLQPTVLSSQLLPATLAEYRTLPGSVLDDYVGDYELAPGATDFGDYELTAGATVRVFLFDEKPYIHMPGVGDAMLFPIARDTFNFRVLQGVQIAFERGADDEVTAVDSHARRGYAQGSQDIAAAIARPPSVGVSWQPSAHCCSMHPPDLRHPP